MAAPAVVAGQAGPDDDGEVRWDAAGVLVRFPLAMAPLAIGRDTTVGDRFSGYEWRVVMEQGTTSWLVAFVVPPDPRQLTLAPFASNEDAVHAGGSRIRRCEPELVTIRCGRAARGLVRVTAGQLELLVAESRWITAAAGQGATIHLAVRRGGAELWSAAHHLPPIPD